MSLVAYENSSDSENEITSDTNCEVTTERSYIDNQIINDNNLFINLPKPKIPTLIKEETDEFLTKKEACIEKPRKTTHVKISIPSLSEFDSDDEMPPAKKPLCQKASGLFALLPSPKSTPVATKIFVPSSVKSNKVIKPVMKHRSQSKVEKGESEDSEMSEDESNVSSLLETFDDRIWQKVCGRRTPKSEVPTVTKPAALHVIDLAPEPIKPYEGLSNEAFKELLGSKHKEKSDINIIDINEDEILPDKDIWMAKSLTDPELAPKYVIEDPVNDTCRRKHHITYLAQQAKANEQELKNQWAANRYTRQKTQAKYGF